MEAIFSVNTSSRSVTDSPPNCTTLAVVDGCSEPLCSVENQFTLSLEGTNSTGSTACPKAVTVASSDSVQKQLTSHFDLRHPHQPVGLSQPSLSHHHHQRLMRFTNDDIVLCMKSDLPVSTTNLSGASLSTHQQSALLPVSSVSHQAGTVADNHVVQDDDVDDDVRCLLAAAAAVAAKTSASSSPSQPPRPESSSGLNTPPDTHLLRDSHDESDRTDCRHHGIGDGSASRLYVPRLGPSRVDYLMSPSPNESIVHGITPTNTLGSVFTDLELTESKQRSESEHTFAFGKLEVNANESDPRCPATDSLSVSSSTNNDLTHFFTPSKTDLPSFQPVLKVSSPLPTQTTRESVPFFPTCSPDHHQQQCDHEPTIPFTRSGGFESTSFMSSIPVLSGSPSPTRPSLSTPELISTPAPPSVVAASISTNEATTRDNDDFSVQSQYVKYDESSNPFAEYSTSSTVLKPDESCSDYRHPVAVDDDRRIDVETDKSSPHSLSDWNSIGVNEKQVDANRLEQVLQLSPSKLRGADDEFECSTATAENLMDLEQVISSHSAALPKDDDDIFNLKAPTFSSGTDSNIQSVCSSGGPHLSDPDTLLLQPGRTLSPSVGRLEGSEPGGNVELTPHEITPKSESVMTTETGSNACFSSNPLSQPDVSADTFRDRLNEEPHSAKSLPSILSPSTEAATLTSEPDASLRPSSVPTTVSPCSHTVTVTKDVKRNDDESKVRTKMDPRSPCVSSICPDNLIAKDLEAGNGRSIPEINTCAEVAADSLINENSQVIPHITECKIVSEPVTGSTDGTSTSQNPVIPAIIPTQRDENMTKDLSDCDDSECAAAAVAAVTDVVFALAGNRKPDPSLTMDPALEGTGTDRIFTLSLAPPAHECQHHQQYQRTSISTDLVSLGNLSHTDSVVSFAVASESLSTNGSPMIPRRASDLLGSGRACSTICSVGIPGSLDSTACVPYQQALLQDSNSESPSQQQMVTDPSRRLYHSCSDPNSTSELAGAGCWSSEGSGRPSAPTVGVGDFLCQSCNRVFPQKALLLKHRVMHEEPKHICDSCGRSFVREDKLKRHVMSIHTAEKPHICHICTKAFSRKDKLKDHLKHHDRAARSFECQQCQQPFVQKSDLNRHIRGVHQGEPGVGINMGTRRRSTSGSVPNTPSRLSRKRIRPISSSLTNATDLGTSQTDLGNQSSTNQNGTRLINCGKRKSSGAVTTGPNDCSPSPGSLLKADTGVSSSFATTPVSSMAVVAAAAAAMTQPTSALAAVASSASLILPTVTISHQQFVQQQQQQQQQQQAVAAAAAAIQQQQQEKPGSQGAQQAQQFFTVATLSNQAQAAQRTATVAGIPHHMHQQIPQFQPELKAVATPSGPMMVLTRIAAANQACGATGAQLAGQAVFPHVVGFQPATAHQQQQLQQQMQQQQQVVAVAAQQQQQQQLLQQQQQQQVQYAAAAAAHHQLQLQQHQQAVSQQQAVALAAQQNAAAAHSFFFPATAGAASGHPAAFFCHPGQEGMAAGLILASSAAAAANDPTSFALAAAAQAQAVAAAAAAQQRQQQQQAAALAAAAASGGTANGVMTSGSGGAGGAVALSASALAGLQVVAGYADASVGQQQQQPQEQQQQHQQLLLQHQRLTAVPNGTVAANGGIEETDTLRRQQMMAATTHQPDPSAFTMNNCYQLAAALYHQQQHQQQQQQHGLVFTPGHSASPTVTAMALQQHHQQQQQQQQHYHHQHLHHQAGLMAAAAYHHQQQQVAVHHALQQQQQQQQQQQPQPSS